MIEEQALKATSENRARGRGSGGFRGRGRGRGMSSFDKSTVECYHCHKLGTFQYECPSKESTTNFVVSQEEMLLMTHLEDTQTQKKDSWCLDSGCKVTCVAKRNCSLI